MTPYQGDGRHHCPAPGGAQRVPFEHFACPRHRYSIRPRLRHELGRAYRQAFGEARLPGVRAECLRALSVLEDQIANENASVA